MESENLLDPNNLPEFDCICELCDCGCFEESKQPHSISCKRFFNQRQPTALNKGMNRFEQNMTKPLTPKGQLSEYTHQYLKNKEQEKMARVRAKDNIDIFNINGKPNEFHSHSSNFEPQMRSKVLDRLSRMMPNNNENVSWYKAETNFFGHNDIHNTNEPHKKKAHTTMDHHKDDYLKTFEEYNRGFVDSYTDKRGSELVSLSKNGEDFSRQLASASDLFKSNSGSVHSHREHDFRSPWIPKKYSGRNMFVSHIDSALFPDKECKDTEVETHYNHFHVPNQEKKQEILVQKAPYPKLDKSVRFAVTNDNKYIPTVICLPRKEPLYEENFHEKPKAGFVQTMPSHSTYQGDYEKPRVAPKKHTVAPLCKAAALQSMMRRDKFMASRFDKNHDHTLESLKKRHGEIDAILMNS